MSLENEDDSGNSRLGKVSRLWAHLLRVEAGGKVAECDSGGRRMTE